MTNKEILTADVLDILFYNRNKDYGAYRLRKTYPRRLLLATALTALCATGLAGFACLHNGSLTPVGMEGPEAVVLTQIELPPPPDDVLRLPETPPPPSEPVATEQFTNKIEIVADHEVSDADVPSTENLATSVIGTDDVAGKAFDGGQQPASPAPAAIPEAPAPPAGPEWYNAATVAQMAEFPGGAGAFQRWLARHLPQPEGLGPGEAKTVKVRFVIEKDGSIDKVLVLQSGGNELDQAVLQTLERAPKWKPAQHEGRAVAVIFTLPIIFMGGND